MVIVENFVLSAVMLIFSIEDIKYKSLAFTRIVVAGITAMIYRGVCIIVTIQSGAKINRIEVVMGIIFLGSFLLMSIITKCIGMGDVAVVAIVALVKGAVFAVSTFMVAIICVFIMALIMVLLRRFNRKKVIPLVPYISIGMVVMMCV